MNTLQQLKCLGAIGFVSASALVNAQSTWTGSISNDWATAGNWSPSGVPNTGGGAAAIINSGTIVYTAGGDFAINNGGSFTLNGGSFTQAGGISWMQLGGGTLNVSGGSFSTGTAGNMIINASTVINVSAGSFNYATGNLTFSTGTLNVSGGSMTVAGELKPVGGALTLSGGTLTASLLAFDGGVTKMNVSGGSMTVTGSAFDGVFSVGGYVNFTSGSSGSLVLSSVSATSAANLLTGRVRVGDTVDADAFLITSINGGAGSMITLVSAIPEPSAFAAVAGLGVLGLALSRRRRA